LIAALALSTGSFSGAAKAQAVCPTGEIASPASGRCEKAPNEEVSGRNNALAPPDNPPPAPGSLTVDRMRGLTSPSATTGPCPNTTSYAYDPRIGHCVALPACPGGLIWNPDQSRCVPPPPGGVLECLDGYGFDTAKNACVAPNCGALVFNPLQGKCLPPAPVICAVGSKLDVQQNQCVAELYDIMEFVIVTGEDDLRTASTAWALWTNPGGVGGNCTLHGGGDSWNDATTHAVLCDLGPHPMTLAQLQGAKISIAYNGAPGNGFDEPDNWNLQSVQILALNPGEGAVCVFAASGDPLHRFQEVQASPSFSDPGLQDLPAYDGIIVTDYPGHCP